MPRGGVVYVQDYEHHFFRCPHDRSDRVRRPQAAREQGAAHERAARALADCDKRIADSGCSA
jgi:hypothetical protein